MGDSVHELLQYTEPQISQRSRQKRGFKLLSHITCTSKLASQLRVTSWCHRRNITVKVKYTVEKQNYSIFINYIYIYIYIY